MCDLGIKKTVSIDDSQFGIVTGRGATDAIFVVQQEKYPAVNKPLYIAFLDLEMASDHVLLIFQEMYANVRSQGPSGSVLSPLLFIIVLEA